MIMLSYAKFYGLTDHLLTYSEYVSSNGSAHLAESYYLELIAGNLRMLNVIILGVHWSASWCSLINAFF